MSVLLGNGDGTLQPQQTFTTPYFNTSVAVADLGHSGHLDFAAGGFVRGVAVGDFHGTGAPDLVVANPLSDAVSLLPNQSAFAAALVLSGPSQAAAGQPFQITVTILNQFGGVYTGYTGTVTFTSSDGGATLPGDYTFTAGDQGSHTFTVTLQAPGSQTITASDPALSLADTLAVEVS